MTGLPKSGSTLLIRTDFSSQDAWKALSNAVTTPNADGFVASLHLVDAPAYRDQSSEQLAALAGTDTLLVIADRRAHVTPERQVLALYVKDNKKQELRVVADQLWSLENNLSLGNMDWDEFVRAADADGVFRGF